MIVVTDVGPGVSPAGKLWPVWRGDWDRIVLLTSVGAAGMLAALRGRAVSRRLASAACLVFCAGVAACGTDGPQEPRPPGAGVLSLTTRTVGLDLDDAYVVSVDGAGATTIAATASTQIIDVAVGSRVVALTGLTSNCTAQGGSTRTVNVVRNASVEVAFDITCMGTLLDVVTGTRSSCGRSQSGFLYCWGANNVGQLGNGTSSNSSNPVRVNNSADLVTVLSGAMFACGLTSGGAARCWGRDVFGEIGAGLPGETCAGVSCRTNPTAVSGGHTFTRLALGWANACGLVASGAALCWGDGRFGQLGQGNALLTACAVGPCSDVPVQVTGGRVFTELAVGGSHVCGLSGGAAYCWGDNEAGQLGIGVAAATETCFGVPCSRTPVAVVGGHSFTQLSARMHYTCGLASDGWYCWGSNNIGQVGNGVVGPQNCLGPSPLCQSTPMKIAPTGIAQLAAGWRHGCGLTSEGAARCWGFNANGQLGDGTQTDRLNDVAVGGPLRFTVVRPSETHTCGRDTTGIVHCWGDNASGQLGDVSTIGRLTPNRVVGQ